ncbi:DoxX family protein [Deinococcus antarcticus]|uniref:DoxX family protein n=1 Tax=Deinococcus antarcticus TaxID=1298767 RepID=A0ABV8A3S2_9DEIO
MNSTSHRAATTPVRAASVATWGVKALLALQFLMGGALKLSGEATMVEMFAGIGAGQGLRSLVGVLEIAGALGLLVPKVSGLVALGLSGVMVGAVLTRTFVLGGFPGIELVFLALSGLVAYRARSHTQALLGAKKGA